MARFSKGQTVRARLDAQGLRAGQAYLVEDVTEEGYIWSSPLVTYAVRGDDGKALQIVNGHLLLDEVKKAAPVKTTVRFETRHYENAHGALPRGRGCWAFAEEQKAASPLNQDIFWAPGGLTYAEAKKVAKAHYAKLGSARGDDNLYVAVLS